MDALSSIFTWLSDHEAGISAVVGIMVLAGAVFAGVRSLLHRAADTSEAKTPGASAETHLATDSPPTTPIQEAATASDKEQQARLLLVVFTDLVGSTALKSKVGDEGARALISRHRAHVRQLLSETGGREIDCALDGFFLTFDSPSAAATFALQLQKIHHAEADLPAVRVGIHLGEITERPAPPRSSKPVLVEGLAVDLAAGIQALAQPSQILMSSPVFNAMRQGLKGQELERKVAWRAHGAYRFKDVDDAVEIGEVGFEGISPLEAPPDSETARRAVVAGDELTLGWRPGVGLGIPGRPHWRLQEQLGSGAIGEVWLAQHASTHAHRVFKFCFQAESLRSLKREVVLLRLLKESLGERPDIAKVIDWQFDEPPYYFETEHSEAGNLVDWSRRQGGIEKVPLATRLDIVARIADALQAAHRAGVLHKDLKPANVLVYEDEEGRPHIRLTDFGIGLVTSREALDVPGVTVAGLTEALLSSGTSTGAGTRLYMAPEVAEGHQATPLSDVYSLGVILYQIVAGDFGHALATGWERGVEDPLLREDIAAVVDGDPEKRLPGPEELARRLRALPERRAKVRTTRNRRRRLIAAGAAAALALLAVGGWRGFQLWSKARWARDTAVPEIIRMAESGTSSPLSLWPLRSSVSSAQTPASIPCGRELAPRCRCPLSRRGQRFPTSPTPTWRASGRPWVSLRSSRCVCPSVCCDGESRSRATSGASSPSGHPSSPPGPHGNGRCASHWTKRGRRLKGWSRWKAAAFPPSRSPASPRCRRSTWSASTSAARR